MTQFEHMLLGRIDGLTAQVSRLAELVGRLEERQKGQDDRLQDLEEAPAAAPASAPRSRGRGWRENGGLYLSNAAITAIVSALLTLLARAPDAPPATSRPAAAAIEAPR